MSTMREAPSPWTLKGRTWQFFVPPLPAARFPAGWADPSFEAILRAGGEFIGGPGIVQIVSYSESPVGPYDELVYLPGKWKYSDGTEAYRITRIYVSSEASTYNGRRNWNIPKNMATFNFTPSSSPPTPASTWNLTVSPLGSSAPFFAARISPLPQGSRPSPPGPTTAGAPFTLSQPPFPRGNPSAPEEVASGVEGSQDKWASLSPVMTGGPIYPARIEGALPSGRFGDGVGFPDVQPPPEAMVLARDNFDLVFPESEWRSNL